MVIFDLLLFIVLIEDFRLVLDDKIIANLVPESSSDPARFLTATVNLVGIVGIGILSIVTLTGSCLWRRFDWTGFTSLSLNTCLLLNGWSIYFGLGFVNGNALFLR